MTLTGGTACEHLRSTETLAFGSDSEASKKVPSCQICPAGCKGEPVTRDVLSSALEGLPYANTLTHENRPPAHLWRHLNHVAMHGTLQGNCVMSC